MVFDLIALLSLAAWAYLALGRGGFWRCDEREVWVAPPPTWPRVTVVIPARDEAECIGRCLASLFRQDYRGPWSIVLVDDNSSDATAGAARRAAAEGAATDRLTVVAGSALPAGWTGKLWALRQGVAAATAVADTTPEYLLFTDADIVYAPAMLSWLVARARQGDLALVSLMVRLRCESIAERAFIPAFIFFFQMLYPFAWVNRIDRATAAAAGGCMLIRVDALRRSGGIDQIRGALIDDCALARRIKGNGAIWIGLTERVRSIRGYPRLGDIARMVSRSAYAQLRYSPWQLLGTVAAMTVVFLVPPMAALFASDAGRALGIAAWAAMTLLYIPVLRFYGCSLLWAPAFPAIAAAYLAFTIVSALASWRGKGGLWKGRFQAARAK